MQVMLVGVCESVVHLVSQIILGVMLVFWLTSYRVRSR